MKARRNHEAQHRKSPKISLSAQAQMFPQPYAAVHQPQKCGTVEVADLATLPWQRDDTLRMSLQ